MVKGPCDEDRERNKPEARRYVATISKHPKQRTVVTSKKKLYMNSNFPNSIGLLRIHNYSVLPLRATQKLPKTMTGNTHVIIKSPTGGSRISSRDI